MPMARMWSSSCSQAASSMAASCPLSCTNVPLSTGAVWADAEAPRISAPVSTPPSISAPNREARPERLRTGGRGRAGWSRRPMSLTAPMLLGRLFDLWHCGAGLHHHLGQHGPCGTGADLDLDVARGNGVLEVLPVVAVDVLVDDGLGNGAHCQAHVREDLAVVADGD